MESPQEFAKRYFLKANELFSDGQEGFDSFQLLVDMIIERDKESGREEIEIADYIQPID